MPRASRTGSSGVLTRFAAVVSGLLAAVAWAQTINYRLVPMRPLARFTPAQITLLAKLNHADPPHLAGFSRVIAPDRWERDELLYSPMPREIAELSGEPKAIIVDLSAQVFGAYESGRLVRWGPVSTGDSEHRTPSGTYHLNWRSRLRVSSENPDWIMPWYFNFSSTMGLGLHQYTLPGRPASHGCVRLLQTDAKWIFQWGEGWSAEPGFGEARPGTLVLLVNRYNYGAPQPWRRPAWWARGVSLPPLQLPNSDALGQAARSAGDDVKDQQDR